MTDYGCRLSYRRRPRKEDQACFEIKPGIVDAYTDREAIDYFPGDAIHHHHPRLIAATDKQAFHFSIIHDLES